MPAPESIRASRAGDPEAGKAIQREGEGGQGRPDHQQGQGR